MSYIWLAVGLLILLIVAFFASGKELLSPGPIVAASMLVSALLSAYGARSWNNVVLRSDLALILLASTAFFILGTKLARAVLIKRWDNGTSGLVAQQLRISWFVPLVLACFIVVPTFVRVVETFRLANELGIEGTDFMSLVATVREETSGLVTGEYSGFDVGYSFLSRQLDKLMNGAVFSAAILIPVSLAFGKGKKVPLSLTAVFLVGCAASLLSGGRYMLIMYCLALLLTSWICALHNNKNRTTTEVSLKFAVVILCLCSAASLLFFLLSFLLGRTIQGTAANYISFYFGCGIPSFQEIINQGIDPYGIPGFNTFHEQMTFLSKFGLLENLPGYSSFWINFDGYSSNVFTFAYRYYSDFGVIGALALSALGGSVYELLYRVSTSRAGNIVLLAIYPVVGCHLFDVCRDEKLFATLLSPNYLLILLVCLVILYSLRSDFDWRDLKTNVRRALHR